MIKKLDFNALEQPVLELTLKDEARTVVHVTTPNEELIDKLQTVAADLQKVVDDTTGEQVRVCFAFFAELMSHNTDGLTFTAEALRDTYKLKLYDLMVLYKVYIEFINEIQSAKN